MAGRPDIANRRNSLEDHWCVGQQTRCQTRQRRVFSATVLDSSPQRKTAVNDESIHDCSLRGSTIELNSASRLAVEEVCPPSVHHSTDAPVLMKENQIGVRARPNAAFAVLDS